MLWKFAVASIFIVVLITPSMIQILPADIRAEGLSLHVSASERPQFKNHFFGAQIIEIIISDPGATDPDESTSGLIVKGFNTERVHLSDGLWYSFFAEDEAFLTLADVLSDGTRNNVIVVSEGTAASPGATLDYTSVSVGTATFTITNVGGADSFIREISSTAAGPAIAASALKFVEIDQADFFTTLPQPFFEPAPTINPNLRLADAGDTTDPDGAGAADVPDGICESGDFNVAGSDCDWPYIRLFSIEELDQVSIRIGPESVVLTFDDFADSISARIDRVTEYPLNAEIIVGFTDFMWNINPVEEDSVFFALDQDSGGVSNIMYQPVAGFDPAGDGQDFPDISEIFTSSPGLEFDERQILELDAEGLDVLSFAYFLDLDTAGTADPVIGQFEASPFELTFANTRTVDEFDDPDGDLDADEDEAFELGADDATIDPEEEDLPVIGMFEGDPNVSVFDNTVEGQGGRATLFAAVNDRVASFDYFDIINSAPMTTHDGFASVDREIYNSADRAVFTVTDPDQNLRSRISEEPDGRQSKSFMKIGSPLPLGNNPTFAAFFGTNTLPDDDDNGEFNGDSIQAAGFTLAFDPDDVPDVDADGVENEADDAEAELDNVADIDVTGFTTAGCTGAGVADTAAATTGFTITIDPPVAKILVIIDDDRDGCIELDGSATTGDRIFQADDPDDLADADPERSQIIGFEYEADTIGDDLPSGLVINTDLTLADLSTTITIQDITNEQIDAASDGDLAQQVGRAFNVDPFIAAVGAFIDGTTVADSTDDWTALTDGDGARDFIMPRYNLINADFGRTVFAVAEDVTDDNLDAIAIQITAFDDDEQLSQLVDFNPFSAEDIDADDNVYDVDLLTRATRSDIGSFRIVEFLLNDWDDDGGAASSFLEGDNNDLTQLATGVQIRVEVVFITNDDANDGPRPVDVLDTENSISIIDFSGITIFTEQTSDASVDQIELIANTHLVYRIELDEEGSNSSIFTGRADFFTANQFDTTEAVLQDIVVTGDPVKVFVPNRFIPPNRLAFAHSDVDIIQVFRAVSATFIYETTDGSLEWDRSSFSFGQDAFLTLVDEDLNRRPDATERYDLPVAGFVFFELGKQRVVDLVDTAVADTNECNVDDEFCFFEQIDATLLETGPNTGTFVSQITMNQQIMVATAAGDDDTFGTDDDTVADTVTQQRDLEANYIDVRDRSSIAQEFDDITNIRTTLGDVVLDRTAYPPSAIMYVEIHDNDFNTDVDIRETIDLRLLVAKDAITGAIGTFAEGTLFGSDQEDVPTQCDEEAEFNAFALDGVCAALAPILEVTIFKTVGKLVTLLPVGLANMPDDGVDTTTASGLEDRFGTGVVTSVDATPRTILPILDRNEQAVTTATETGPNTGIFEFEVQLPGPGLVGPFQTPPADIVTTGTIDEPVITANMPIQVTYFDRADESGEVEDEEELASFLFNTASIASDKPAYHLGEQIILWIVEPDRNLDSRTVEYIPFNEFFVITDKADELPLDFLLIVLQLLGEFITTEPGFREIEPNAGIFAIISPEGVVDETVIDRGEQAEIIFFDKTPSGGGTEIRVEYEVEILEVMPEIVFDKEEYTPFDEVEVRIVSPDSNDEPFEIDTVRVLVSSSSQGGFILNVPETALNTGIFEEDFDLTPNTDMFMGDLLAQREDGVSVEFRIDEDTVVTKSVFVNYHVGNVMFDRNAYRTTDKAILSVIDPDENKNPDTIDTLDARIWSTSDRGGLLLTLRETGDRTGIFEEFITFTTDEESTGTRLRVLDGDTVTAKYTDRTMPAPAALDSDGVFTVEVEELFASSLIGATSQPLERTLISEPTLVDQNGLPIEQVEVDQQVLIQSEITNNQNVKQKFAYIVQVKDFDGVTISLSWVSGELPPNDVIIAAQSWIPEKTGRYEIEVFVWENIDNPVALSPTRTLSVTVS